MGGRQGENTNTSRRSEGINQIPKTQKETKTINNHAREPTRGGQIPIRPKPNENFKPKGAAASRVATWPNNL